VPPAAPPPKKEEEHELTDERPVRRSIKVLIISSIFAVLGLVAYLTIAIAFPASKAANGFCAALRSGNLDQAKTFATDDLAARIANPPDDDEGRTLMRLKTSDPIDVGVGQLGGGFTKGCFTTDLKDKKPLHIIVEKQNGKWRVTSVHTETPKYCELQPI
jgi:hypothetical protein